jgi:hypothetical protein
MEEFSSEHEINKRNGKGEKDPTLGMEQVGVGLVKQSDRSVAA